VFKPSPQAAASGEALVQCLYDAGVPEHVLHLCQGDSATAEALIASEAVSAVFFTGSYTVGRAIHRQLAGRPEVLLALEMGGNNPFIVWHPDDVVQAAHCVARSSWISGGQRCTNSRRLILPRDAGSEQLLAQLLALAHSLRVHDPLAEAQPFYGSLLSQAATERVLSYQQKLIDLGAKVLAPCSQPDASHPTLVRPGILDVTGIDCADEECFGPLLLLRYADDFPRALHVANDTCYGLSAGLIDADPLNWQQFRRNVRAGVLSWNRPTAGASGKMAFGGVGASGNHRSLAWHALDHLADPVAALSGEKLAEPQLPGLS